MTRSKSGAVDRRTFVKDAALAAAAAGGLTGGLGALSSLLAQPRPFSPSSRLVAATGQSRPFNMVCLGDSVMWGQGLEDPNKFSSLVETWLETKLQGRRVNRFVYARSGATIRPDPKFDQAKIADWMNDRSLGEVPCSWPWVQQQVVVARDHLNSQRISANAVDLVLLDGGINDLGVGTLLNEFNTTDMIKRNSAEFCNVQMLDLLARVRSVFQSAKILVTGYFPIVSEKSDLGFISALISFPVPPPISIALTADARSRLAALSTAWYDASNADLEAAVASFNTKWAWNQSHNTPAAAFVKVPWGPEHSYAAPNTRLWLIGLPNDPVYWQREAACRAAGQDLNPVCRDAKMGHPNVSGAAAYATACQNQLTQYLVEWGGLKPMSACVEMDSMPMPGVATTLLVHATEVGRESWKTVRGTVRVGSQAFATDTPVPVTLCTRRTSSGGGGAAEIVCTPMTVSAPGYVDVVINDYLAATPVP